MEQKKKITSKQVVAIIGIIVLVGMYIATLVVALVIPPAAIHMFFLSAALTVFIPALIWVYIWLYGIITDKKTIASFQTDKEQEE